MKTALQFYSVKERFWKKFFGAFDDVQKTGCKNLKKLK